MLSNMNLKNLHTFQTTFLDPKPMVHHFMKIFFQLIISIPLQPIPLLISFYTFHVPVLTTLDKLTIFLYVLFFTLKSSIAKIHKGIFDYRLGLYLFHIVNMALLIYIMTIKIYININFIVPQKTKSSYSSEEFTLSFRLSSRLQLSIKLLKSFNDVHIYMLIKWLFYTNYN